MSGVALLGVLDPLVGAVMVVVGGGVWWRARSARAGALLVLSGACWWAGAILPALLALHRGPLLQLIATYPSGRIHNRAALMTVLLGWVMALAGGIVSGPWSLLVAATLFGGAATLRATRAVARGRRILAPEVVGGLSLAAVLVIAAANLRFDLDADLGVAVTYDVVVAFVVVALGADLLRAQTADDISAEVLTSLGPPAGDVPGLQPQLRRILGDPGLTIGYWSLERGTFVDQDGREVEPANHSATTRITQDGRPAAVMFHDPTLSQDPELLQAAGAAVRLTAANAEMRREALDRVARLTEARRRIVEAADVEAQALSRRLEQGPQSLLLEVSEALAQLDDRSCPDPDRATATAVRRELEAAQRELQELAHGVRPESLTEGGLARALPLLAAGSRVVTDIQVEIGRLDPAVEAGLYFFCAEGITNAAKHAPAAEVRVSICAEPGSVVAEVTDNGTGGADAEGSGLRGIRDRIEALGGTVEIASDIPRRGVRLVARVPTEKVAQP